jgi:iron complex outermembrane receptor protein
LITQNSLDVSDVSRVGPDHSVATETSTAEQVEILRGPATLFFGSGAIGGVVNVVDNRVPRDTETSGEWQLSHDSVNDQDFASFNLNAGGGNIGFHIDGFWRESNEYEVPVSPEADEDHGERVVENTAEESDGITIGTSYILDNGFVGVSYGRMNRDYGIPGHAHGEEEHEGEEHEEEEHEEEHHEEGEEVLLGMEQDRFQLISELSFDDSFISSLNTRAAYTDYTHTEFENGSAGTTFTNETAELKLELLHEELAGWHGGIIFDYKQSEFSAVGEEAFAPPSETDSFAIALVEEKHIGDVLLQMGARVEHVNISSDEVAIPDVEFHSHDEEGEEGEHEEEEHETEILSFDENFTPISLSIGAVWNFTPGYNVGVSVSRAERAPSAAELLSFGPHIATGTFEIGALFEEHMEEGEVHFEAREDKPEMETSTNLDVSFRKFEGDVGIILNAFYNQVDNYYTEFDTEYFAEVSHDHEEEGEEHEGEEHEGEEEHAHADELPVFVFRAEDVTLYGFEAQGVWQMSEQFRTTIFGDYVRAELDDGGNLPRIPPMRFGASFDIDIGNISANLSWTHYAKQDDVAELESETDSYDWVTANVNYHIPLDDTDLTVFLRVDNIGDEEARVHSSFIKDLAPRPGRNFRFGVRGTF